MNARPNLALQREVTRHEPLSFIITTWTSYLKFPPEASSRLSVRIIPRRNLDTLGHHTKVVIPDYAFRYGSRTRAPNP